MLMAGLAMASRSSIRARRWTRTRQAKEELKEIPTVCGSSREALENHIRTPRLPASAAYSTTTSSTALSKPEDDRGELPEMTPHPVEFDMYYSL
jgi:glutamine synthetase